MFGHTHSVLDFNIDSNSNSHLKMVRQPAHAKIRIPLEYPGHNEQTYAVSFGQVEE